jgi:hypothetical protein
LKLNGHLQRRGVDHSIRAIAALCVGYPGPHADHAEAQGYLDEDQLGVVDPGYLRLAAWPAAGRPSLLTELPG